MIFLFLLTSGTSVYFLAIESQASMIETQEVVNNIQTRKTQENFDVSISTDSEDNNRLAIQIKNQGGFPLEIADFWIINKTDAVNEFPVIRYEVNFTEPYIPPGYAANILENYPLYMIPDTYNIKVVSTLGTIHQKEVVVGGNNNLVAEIITIPTDVKVNQNVTIAMHVTNVGDTKLENVQPQPLSIIPSSGVQPPFPNEPLAITLDPAESKIFTWKYVADGIVGNNVVFSSNVTATETITGFNVTSNNASDEITLREPDIEELIVLSQDLIARPEMFMTIPAPFGDVSNTDKGLWAMNIVNPTSQSMNVTKIVFTGIIPRPNLQNHLFTLNCQVTAIQPTTGSWKCPIENQLVWEKGISDDPQIVPPLSTVSFRAKVQPGQITSPTFNIQTAVVHGSVFTSVGEFGKSEYGSSISIAQQAIPGVYLSSTTESTADNTIYTNMSNISAGSTVKFNATLADFHTVSSTYIKQGSTMIINVPKDWSTPNLLSWNGFENNPTVQSFSDGSHQIIGKLSANLDGSTITSRTIQFESDAPVVTSTRMYVMYMLAEGYTQNDFTVSPLSESIIHVIP